MKKHFNKKSTEYRKQNDTQQIAGEFSKKQKKINLKNEM